MSDLVQEISVKLLADTPEAWIENVLANFDLFLLDHASAERKASAMAVSFVVQYPNRYELHLPMIRLAREELLHYQQVMEMIHERKLLWERDVKDPYVGELLSHLRTGSDERLLDRLMMGGVIEARGVERFGLVGKHHPDPQLRIFYDRLAKSEANHATLFPSLARHYFSEAQVAEALDRWLRFEAQALRNLEIRPALH